MPCSCAPASRSSASNEGRVKQPLNAFFLFSKSGLCQAMIGNVRGAERQQAAGRAWRSLDEKFKEQFFQEAARKKQQHREEHPDYVHHLRKRVRGPEEQGNSQTATNAASTSASPNPRPTEETVNEESAFDLADQESVSWSGSNQMLPLLLPNFDGQLNCHQVHVPSEFSVYPPPSNFKPDGPPSSMSD